VDIRAKERLTGAVILVAVIVFVVPALLTGPRRATAPPVEPADQPPLRSYTVDLTDGGRATAASGPLTQSPAPSAAPVEPPEKAAESAAGSVEEQPAPRHDAEQGAAGASKGTPHGSTSAVKEAPPRAQGAASAAHGPDHVAPPTARMGAQADTGPVTGWSVQIGSFASRENADRLVHELKARRFSAFVSESTSNGRKLFRVRVGPEPDHAAAQTLATRLRSAGHTGSIVPNP
jgi:cell division septation protein DedD